MSPGRASAVLAAVVVQLATACAEPPGFALHGARVVIETDAPFARQPDFPARLESTIEAALRYWGGSWDALDGASIELVGDPYVRCGAVSALGCWDGDLRFTTRDPGAGTFRCIEQTFLVHEIGHAVLGDRLHQDPRWMSFEPVRDALAERTGYTSGGVADCVISPSVWQHPLGRP